MFKCFLDFVIHRKNLFVRNEKMCNFIQYSQSPILIFYLSKCDFFDKHFLMYFELEHFPLMECRSKIYNQI